MNLRNDEFRIEGEGIWLSKKTLMEWRDHYCKLADQNRNNKKKYLQFLYCGSSSTLADILKLFPE